MNHFYIILILWSNQLSAQSFVVHYDTYYNGEHYQNLLYVNDSVSIWEDMSGQEDQSTERLVKNMMMQTVTYTDHVFQKVFVVSDSLHPMQWEFLPSTKEILTYPCRSARTFFRGREYQAYYTSQLRSHIGPWKFGGLPGAILEVSSSDEFYKFQANRIKEADTISARASLPNEDESILWPVYCYRFIKAIDQYVRYLQTTNNLPGGKVNIKIDRPEIIYPRVQTGAGIDTE